MGTVRLAEIPLPHRRSLPGATWLAIAALVLALTLGGCVPTKPTQEEAMQDIFQLLGDQGFTANVGLSGIFAPGNVIQTMEPAPDGARPLRSPVVLLWGSRCFPDQMPQISAFILPDTSERRAGSISLGVRILALFLPSLNLDRSAVADYTLTLGETEVQTFAKLDLSRQFSEECVQALARAIEDGDQTEWFSVIVEAVVADSLSLEMFWREGTSFGARASQKGAATSQLGRILRGAAAPSLPVSASLGVASENDKTTVLRADVPVIIGYRMRPLQPVYKE